MQRGTLRAVRTTVRSLRDEGGFAACTSPDGRPIVLIHGFASASAVMVPLERHLRRTLGRPVVRLRLGGLSPLQFQDVRRSAEIVQQEIERLAEDPAFQNIDVVGHSLGGLVATYLLKFLDRGRRIRRVVTLGTPHSGTPAAILGVLFFGLMSRAVWQMLPGSPLLRRLACAPVPPGCELVALASTGDSLVPARYARLEARPRQTTTLLPELEHWQFLLSGVAFRSVSGLLGVELAAEPTSLATEAA